MSLKDLPALANIPFISAEDLRPPPGIPTGINTLDNFLVWDGIPQGDITLFQGKPGTGATSLWIHTTQQVHKNNKWAAWINGTTQLLPTHLIHKNINLKKLLVVKHPKDIEKLFWMLQELITSSLFEIIGCEVPEMNFKNHQLQKIKNLCRIHKVSLVFISQKFSKFINTNFSLVIHFQRDFITIQKAAHRPTPFTISGNSIHANFMHQFKNPTRTLLR